MLKNGGLQKLGIQLQQRRTLAIPWFHRLPRSANRPKYVLRLSILHPRWAVELRQGR